MNERTCSDCCFYSSEQECCVEFGVEIPPNAPVGECKKFVGVKAVRDFVVKDSGNREEFATGAVRDTADDKPRPDLVSPFFLVRLGTHLRKGAVKYSEWNWAKGIPSSRCYASCMRHLMAYAMGKRDEDHLAAAVFNLMAIIHNEEVAGKARLVEQHTGLNDMPKFEESEEL